MKNFLLNPVLKSNTIQPNDTLHDKFRKLGANTGNMVFVNSLKEQISFEKEDWLNPDMEFSDNYTYVIPCSNFLHVSNKWLEPLTEIIEKQPIKIVLIGLGTQANLNDSPETVVKQLSEKQKRFFSIVSERCNNLGVRGEYTAECLNLIGIKNSKVIGCPSLYKYWDGNFPKLKPASFENALATITPSNGILSTRILNLAIDYQFHWIMQSEAELTSMYSSNPLLKMLQQQWRFPFSSWKKLNEYADIHSDIFWNYDNWNNHLANSNYTFSFGTRFHGNMMALRNHIPALWIIHDMRTKELVETLKVPSIHKNFDFCKPEKLLDACDYTEFYKNYAAKVKIYKEFLHEEGII